MDRGVVEKDGELLGAYRDENGNVSLVHLRCPHLGCTSAGILMKSPGIAHVTEPGLDYKGNIISNPAIEDSHHTEKHNS